MQLAFIDADDIPLSPHLHHFRPPLLRQRRDLCTGGVNHDYDRARTTVVIGIAGDILSDPGAVLDRLFSRAK